MSTGQHRGRGTPWPLAAVTTLVVAILAVAILAGFVSRPAVYAGFHPLFPFGFFWIWPFFGFLFIFLVTRWFFWGWGWRGGYERYSEAMKILEERYAGGGDHEGAVRADEGGHRGKVIAMSVVSILPRVQNVTPALRVLTAANAALYFLAAVLHLGVKLPFGFVTLGFPQPIPQATVAETLIGGVLAVGALFARGHAARLGWGAYVFALIGTLFGLTVVLLRGLGGPDLAVHFGMLAGLAAGFVLLLTARDPVVDSRSGMGRVT